jgi:hypothetical protein
MTDSQFLERWQLWMTALNGRDDPPHSLVQQMESRCWDVAVFEALMASWRTETAADGETLEVNSILFHFVMQNYGKSFCLDLRRLTEVQNLVESAPSKRDFSVYSLPSLLADIKAHRQEYTRRRLFLACQLEYDVESIRKKHLEWSLKQRPGAVSSVPRELSEGPSELTHQQWDRLCRCPTGKRSPEDCISLDHLEYLESEVAAIRDSVEFVVNKHFAHAATPQSRKSAEGKKESVTFSELIELLVRAGCMVNSVSAILSSAVFPFLAVAPFDKWEHWSRGWNVSSKILEDAWDRWEARVRRIEPVYYGQSKDK